jgi:hypothetical protein
MTAEMAVERDENGKIKAGSVLNAGGRPTSIWTPYATRVAQLTENYTTEEILAIVSDEKKLAKICVHPMDAMAFMHIARAIDRNLTTTASGNDDLRGERDALLDRVEGKSKSTTQIQNADGSNISPVINVVGVAANKQDAD